MLLELLKGGSVQRVPGNAVFLTGNPRGLPPGLLHSMKHYKVLHQRVVLLTVDIEDVPHVPDEQRFELFVQRADRRQQMGEPREPERPDRYMFD